MLIEPVISAWKAGHPSVSGHQGRYAMRELVNAILYQNRRRGYPQPAQRMMGRQRAMSNGPRAR
nr:hypothetical protein [Streptomyces sp. WAC00263]